MTAINLFAEIIALVNISSATVNGSIYKTIVLAK